MCVPSECEGVSRSVSLEHGRVRDDEGLTVSIGMNLDPVAYFLAKNLVDVPRIILLTAMITFAFYPQANPLTSLGEFCIKALAGSSLTTHDTNTPRYHPLRCHGPRQ